MVDVAVIGALTFGNDDYFLTLSDDSVAHWLYFRAVTYDNISSSVLSISPWRRNHIIHAQSIADDIYTRLSNCISNKSHVFPPYGCYI